jgi:drug/metabolite transporter (DMT)-like permease
MGAFTYTHPIISTALGIVWLGEVVTRNLLIGGALVLGGVYLIQSGQEPTSRRRAAESQYT